MITIDQLLESVDLDFEPRFVTKDKNGLVSIWQKKTEIAPYADFWARGEPCAAIRHIKLAEFENKSWSECIYEVPQKKKTVRKIENIHIPDMDEVAESAMYSKELAKRLNQVIDAVNELKGAKND